MRQFPYYVCITYCYKIVSYSYIGYRLSYILSICKEYHQAFCLCLIGFTLSEIAISRSLRIDTSINLKEKEKRRADRDTIIHDHSVSHPKLTTEHRQLVTDKLGYRNPNTQNIATKEQFTLTDFVKDDKDDIVVKILPGDEEHESFVIKSDNNPLYDKSTNTKNKYSSYIKDNEQAYTDDRTIEGKHIKIEAPKELAAGNLLEFTEETGNKEITHTEDLFDKYTMQTIELYVPAKQKENFDQTGTYIVFTNTIKSYTQFPEKGNPAESLDKI